MWRPRDRERVEERFDDDRGYDRDHERFDDQWDRDRMYGSDRGWDYDRERGFGGRDDCDSRRR